jgi:hypothetical protein
VPTTVGFFGVGGRVRGDSAEGATKVEFFETVIVSPPPEKVSLVPDLPRR